MDRPGNEVDPHLCRPEVVNWSLSSFSNFWTPSKQTELQKQLRKASVRKKFRGVQVFPHFPLHANTAFAKVLQSIMGISWNYCHILHFVADFPKKSQGHSLHFVADFHLNQGHNFLIQSLISFRISTSQWGRCTYEVMHREGINSWQLKLKRKNARLEKSLQSFF